MKCASWGIVTANSFPVDSGIERVRGEEHAKALVEFAYCYLRQNWYRETGMAPDISWPRHYAGPLRSRQEQVMTPPWPTIANPY